MSIALPPHTIWNNKDQARVWLANHGFQWDSPVVGSPMYQCVRSHTNHIAQNVAPGRPERYPVDLAPYLSDYEQDKMEYQFPAQPGQWITDEDPKRTAIYRHVYAGSPAGPKPADPSDKKAMREWLEQYYHKRNRVQGSPMYQFVLKEITRPQYIGEEREVQEWVLHLSEGERRRLNVAHGYHLQRLEARTVYYRHSEIKRYIMEPLTNRPANRRGRTRRQLQRHNPAYRQQVANRPGFLADYRRRLRSGAAYGSHTRQQGGRREYCI